jgi:DNA polymerase III subunit delta
MAMSIHLVTGDDPSLVLSAVGALLDELVGTDDRSLMVDDFDDDEYELAAVVDAAQTPPLFTASRVVVARGVGRFDAEDAAPLVDYLANPLESTSMVLVGGGGRLPKSLSDALKKGGVVTHDTSPPTRASDRAGWMNEHIARAGVRLDAEATRRLGAWLGEDVGRLDGILETLVSTYGTAKTLRSDEVAPFLGDGGGVPPWDLTDAIDRGDTSTCLTLLHRMMRAGERHPLQIMAILHAHYGKLLAIDGLEVRDEASAAAAMGIKPGYPAKKAMEQYRRLGSGAVSRAVGLMAQADLDLRGEKEWPEELVMEVLVARLSRLTPRR